MSSSETAFHACERAHTSACENWSDAGGTDAIARATVKWRETLGRYAPPPLDLAVDEALHAFIAGRKAAMPDI